ncbi:MAG: hypothetical protein TECD_00370 [Hyphomicrobiaceae bacterium hypho_1]
MFDKVRLNILREEHSRLNVLVLRLEENNQSDQLQIRRLKKQKLALKNAILNLEDRLCPDIIA